ncbi:hypothetical protein K1T71_007157 [Dendrolimus kikuchii]|uniref:Uncharacterized protein n=1 Tax=Dendrolimus kikuchii TaxID=765133 RepID=A0ACC1D0Q3_9NEOP|nr:hypothetical protein K1T71_007157 [Dendrolimus kikuchii]
MKCYLEANIIYISVSQKTRKILLNRETNNKENLKHKYAQCYCNCVTGKSLTMLLKASFTIFIMSYAAGIFAQKNSDVPNIDVTYNKQVLKTNIEHPSELSMDYDKNNLFYNYVEVDGIKTISKTAYLNLDTLKAAEIKDGTDLITSAIDNKNHKVYLGGKDGIYTFDYNTKKAFKLDVNDANEKSIWQLFYKDGLYFTTFDPEEQAFYCKSFDKVQKLTDDNNPRMRVLGVSNDNIIYFGNSTGLFYVQNSTGKATLLIEDIVVNAFNVDRDGELYFSTPSSLHHIKTKPKSVEKLTEFQDHSLWGFAIDGNGNIIYGSDDSIIRLVPTLTKQY